MKTIYLERENQGKTIVLTTHGDIGKMIRAAYHRWDYETGLKTPHFSNTEILELKPEKDELE